MNEAAARARLTVRPSSWHYRVHAWWAREKGKQERPTDLCHYFWRVILWAPLRFFFTKGPALLLAVLSVVAFAVYALVAWGGEIAHALALVVEKGWIVVALAVFSIASVILLVLAGRLLLGWNMEVVDRRLTRAVDAVAGGWRWFWTRPLIRTRWVGIAPFAFVFAALYVLALALDSRVTLISTGIIFGIFAIVAAVIVGIVFLIDFAKDRKARKAELEPKAEVEEKEEVVREPSWSGLRILWAFFVAKKHRICPLIEVRP